MEASLSLIGCKWMRGRNSRHGICQKLERSCDVMLVVMVVLVVMDGCVSAVNCWV